MPKQKPSFEELIRQKKITFHSYGRELKTQMKDFGEYNWDLINHLMKDSGNKITIAGEGLERYLGHPSQMYKLADFVIQLWYKGTERYPQDMTIHVAVDLDVLNARYLKQRKPETEKIVNGFNQVVGETSSWLPEMPYIEKVWNFALCNAVGGMVGSPGYEYPRDEASFLAEATCHAQHYIIGIPQQVKRYEKYALEYLESFLQKAEELKKNPRHMFEDPYGLFSVEQSVSSARKIAENVERFSKDYKKK